MHWWKNPIEIVLGLFGLANAGVVFEFTRHGYLFSLIWACWLASPLGLLFTILAKSVFWLEIPAGMTMRHILLINYFFDRVYSRVVCLVTAFPAAGDVLDGAKMGALLALWCALAFIAAISQNPS